MKNLLKILIINLLCSTLFYSCKDNDDFYDKQIRLTFPIYDWGTIDPGWYYSKTEDNITNFNINYYPGVDSVFFVANIGMYFGRDTCHVMLYNVTDSADIPASYIFSTIRNNFELKKSKNLINEFPNKEIELGIKIRYSNEPTAMLTNPMLLLYRE